MQEGFREALSFDLNRKTLIWALSLAGLFVILFWKISSATTGLSAAEVNNIANSHSLHSLYAHPINAPHNIFIWLLFKLNHVTAASTRAISAFFGIAFSICFYKISKSWFGPMVGWLSTLLFITTPLVVLSARSATAEIMFLDPLALLAVYFWLIRRPKPLKLGLALLGAVIISVAYTPGGIYILLAALIFGRKDLVALMKNYPRWLNSVIVLVILAALVPLGLSAFGNHSIVKTLLLVPDHFKNYSLWLSHIGWMALALVWHSGSHSNLQLGRLAVVNVAQLILAACGLYAFWRRARSRVYGPLVILVIGIVGAGTTNNLSFLLVSFASLAIFAGTGLRYLLLEWQGVFPLNPLPRTLATALMVLAVAMSAFYGLKYSLLAWPHNVSTKSTYMLKYPLKE